MCEKLVPAHMPNPNPSMKIVVNSPTYSGKGYMINELLTNPKFGYDKIFDAQNIFVFSPTFESDDVYEGLKKKLKDYPQNIFEDIDYDAMNKVVERQKLAKKERVARPCLFLIDDLITKLTNQRISPLTDMFFSIRHQFVSIIITSQQYKAIPKPIRLNACSLVVFPNNMNRREIKDIGEETPDDMMENCVEELKTNYNRYDFVFLNRRLPKGERWYRNYDELFKCGKHKI